MFNWTHDATLAHAATWLIGKPAAVIGLLILAWVIRWLVHRLIDRLVGRAERGVLPGRLSGSAGGGRRATTRRVQRAKSTGSLLKSLATGLVFGIVAVMILSQLGVNVAPIIASAGVVGLAVGFGAQTLVRDFLSGIAMMIEDQYGVGDVVTIGSVIGTVEAVGLRVTRVRDTEGTVWYVRNGEITSVGNMSQNWARSVLDVKIAYDEEITHVRDVLSDVAREVWHDEEFAGRVIQEPEVWGVQEITPDAVTVRVVLTTAPMEQWGVAREMRQRIVTRFRREGIAIPLSTLVRSRPPGETGGARASADGMRATE
ncbi:MAG: mechanosensitive ion channel family protein [Marmoricola sp.]